MAISERTWPQVNQKRRNLIANGWQFVKQQTVPSGDVIGDLFIRDEDDKSIMFLWSSGNIIELDKEK